MARAEPSRQCSPLRRQWRRALKAGLMLPWLAALAVLPAALSASQSPLVPIEALQLSRYEGRWFELAKYPNVFQRKCVADTSADYALLPSGKVQVTNRCRIAEGSLIVAVGEARVVGPDASATLEVRFAPAWLAWIPLVWGDYWVIDLDAGYTLSAVSEPEREYLWILSRTPEVPESVLKPLLERLEAKGFDLSRLEWTRHSASP
jgi:apolipoprotein D and lipocalin family protein